MIEEDFIREFYDEDDVGIPTRPDSTIDQMSMDDDQRAKIQNEFSKDERIQSFKDFLYVNKFARNCPEHSALRLLAADKYKFKGPDPPLNPSIVEDVEPVIEDVKASGGKAAKKGVEEAPPEV